MNPSKYSPTLRGNVWFVGVAENLLTTPRGIPLGSLCRPLVEKAALDCEHYGEDPSAEWSTYALLCSYMEWAGQDGRPALVDAIISETESDPLYNKLGGVELWREKLQLPDDGQFMELLKSHLNALSSRTLIALVYGCASFHAPLALSLWMAKKIAAKQLNGLLSAHLVIWPFPPKDHKKNMILLRDFAAVPDDREQVIAAAKQQSES
jgi:hypothetical protein